MGTVNDGTHTQLIWQAFQLSPAKEIRETQVLHRLWVAKDYQQQAEDELEFRWEVTAYALARALRMVSKELYYSTTQSPGTVNFAAVYEHRGLDEGIAAFRVIVPHPKTQLSLTDDEVGALTVHVDKDGEVTTTTVNQLLLVNTKLSWKQAMDRGYSALNKLLKVWEHTRLRGQVAAHCSTVNEQCSKANDACGAVQAAAVGTQSPGQVRQATLDHVQQAGQHMESAAKALDEAAQVLGAMKKLGDSLGAFS